MKSIKEIRKGDIVTYKSGRINYVNNPSNYKIFYDESFENISLGQRFKIMKIQRYVKILCFYRLKTIYKRVLDRRD